MDSGDLAVAGQFEHRHADHRGTRTPQQCRWGLLVPRAVAGRVTGCRRLGPLPQKPGEEQVGQEAEWEAPGAAQRPLQYLW